MEKWAWAKLNKTVYLSLEFDSNIFASLLAMIFFPIFLHWKSGKAVVLSYLNINLCYLFGHKKVLIQLFLYMNVKCECEND